MLATTGVEMTLGTEPELRFTPSGKAVCSMRAVTSGRRKNPSTDEWEDVDTTWYEVEVWDRTAENIAESDLKPGMRVIVLGKVTNREWEDKDGNKRYTLTLKADTIGPSLTFQTARVTRTERTGGGQQQQPSRPAQEDPWATGPAPTSQTREPPF